MWETRKNSGNYFKRILINKWALNKKRGKNKYSKNKKPVHRAFSVG